MKDNSKIIVFTIIGLVIGFIVGWLIFSGISTTGNATKGVANKELNTTISDIMTKGISEGSSDDLYVKKLLTNNGYTTTDGKTYINKALSTTTTLCYRPQGGEWGCAGSCVGEGNGCTNNGCQKNTGGCDCVFVNCPIHDGDCDIVMGGGASLD